MIGGDTGSSAVHREWSESVRSLVARVASILVGGKSLRSPCFPYCERARRELVLAEKRHIPWLASVGEVRFAEEHVALGLQLDILTLTQIRQRQIAGSAKNPFMLPAMILIGGT
jgi:hypothetical protein